MSRAEQSKLSAQATSRRNTETVGGKGAITPFEDMSQSGCDGKKIDRPRPPDTPRRAAIDVCSANLRAVG